MHKSIGRQALTGQRTESTKTDIACIYGALGELCIGQRHKRVLLTPQLLGQPDG